MADDENSYTRYRVLIHTKTPDYIKEYLTVKNYLENYEQ